MNEGVKGETVLHEFFAVTRNNSLYRVTDEPWKHNWPLVERLMHNGVPQNPDQPYRLENGYYVGITADYGITLYYRMERVPAIMLNTKHWGGHTTPIVALFLDENEARQCLNTKNRLRWDDRWQAQTQHVLALIGRDHHIFTPDEALIPSDERIALARAFMASWEENKDIYIALRNLGTDQNHNG